MRDCPYCQGPLSHEIGQTYGCEKCGKVFLLDEDNETILDIGEKDS